MKRVAESLQNEVKEQKGGFLSMLLGTLGVSLLGNLLTRKGVNKKGKGINRAGEGIIRTGERIIRAVYGHPSFSASQNNTDF